MLMELVQHLAPVDSVDRDQMDIDAPFPGSTGASKLSTTEIIAFMPLFWRLRGER